MKKLLNERHEDLVNMLVRCRIKIDDRDGRIVGDPEGLAILKTSPEDGYLIASSQGNSTFNIYERKLIIINGKILLRDIIFYKH